MGYWDEARKERQLEDELDAFAADLARKKGQTQFFARIGIPTRLLTYLVLFLILYWFMPDKKAFEEPLTFNILFEVVLWFGVAFVLVRALFRPSKHPDVRNLWGYFGILM